MKNLSVILNIVLLVAVGVLYVLHFSSSNCTENKPSTPTNQATKIVYINTDTLLNKYKMAQDLNEAFLKRQEERQATLNVQMKELHQEANEFQYKIQNNGFISEARAVEAQNRILKKEQQLERLKQEMTDKLLVERNELNKKLYDAITNFLKKFNEKHNYSIVLSTTLGGNVLFAEEGFDITEVVVTGLNKDYQPAN